MVILRIFEQVQKQAGFSIADPKVPQKLRLGLGMRTLIALCLRKHKSEAEAKFHSMTGPTKHGLRPFETLLVLLPEEFPLRPSQPNLQLYTNYTSISCRDYKSPAPSFGMSR
jgi:hypothetical protein